MQPSTLAKRGSILLFLALACFYLYGLGHFPLLGPDEPRYAQVAREMYQRGDLITPTLGGHLWFEKPALLYWLIIAGFKVFGVSETAARLGAAVSGLATVLAVFWLGRRVERAAPDQELRGFGFWSALVAGSTIGLIAFSRAASFDIVITATTTWALAVFFIAELEIDGKRRRLLLAGFYVAIGLALLAKGLVGFVVPLGAVFTYYILRGKAPARNVFISLLWGLPISLAVAATWYGPMIWRHGAPFINQFFIEHHFARYLSDKYRHPAPVYFYLLILPALSLPWAAFVFDQIWKSRKILWTHDQIGTRAQIFALAWFFMPLIFFSFSTSKLPGYVLPALPAAALLAGYRLTRINRSVSKNWPMIATGALCLLVAVGVLILAIRTTMLSLSCAVVISVIVGLTGITSFFLPVRVSTIGIAVATLLTLIVTLNCAVPGLVARQHSKHLLELADSKGYSQTRVFGLQRDDRTPEFYAAGRVVYGNEGEPVLYEGLGPIVLESERLNAPLLFFIPRDHLIFLDKFAPGQFEVIGDNGTTALVVVRTR